MSKPRVTFVCPTIYPVLSGRPELTGAGGAEVQQSVIIHMLAERGYPTCVITSDYGQPDREELAGGVIVDKLPKLAERGVKGLRFIHPRLTDYLPLLARQRPDVIYTRTAGAPVAVCAYYAKRHGSKLIYAGANDLEFGRSAIPGVSRRDTALFRWGMKRADVVVTQNMQQRDALLEHWGRQSVVIPNTMEEEGCVQAAFDGPILLVGTVKPIKRPELFIRLAQAVPDRGFRIVGGAGHEVSYFEQIKKTAAELPNVEIAGFVPFARVGREFDGAAILVNTSEVEGFPNTFLQAWLRRTPTLSFVAPIGSGGVTGTVRARDFDDMVQLLRRLTSDRDFWSQASARGHAQYLADHTKSAAVGAYDAMISELCTRA